MVWVARWLGGTFVKTAGLLRKTYRSQGPPRKAGGAREARPEVFTTLAWALADTPRRVLWRWRRMKSASPRPSGDIDLFFYGGAKAPAAKACRR